MSKKPEWWPQNPYFKEAMATIKNDTDYAKAIPDPTLRTAISWYLGNRFWEVASEMLWQAVQNHQGDICRAFFRDNFVILDENEDETEDFKTPNDAVILEQR